jgi:hypothetical protein
MKAITLHGLDSTLWSELSRRSKAEGLSLNATIKGLLEKSLGIRRESGSPAGNPFSDLCGRWTQKDVQEFERITAAFETVDQEDWK